MDLAWFAGWPPLTAPISVVRQYPTAMVLARPLIIDRPLVDNAVAIAQAEQGSGPSNSCTLVP